MGIALIIGLVSASCIGAIGGFVLASYILARRDWKESQDISKLDEIFRQTGLDFSLMIEKLSRMSVKAQATFAYQYTQMLRNTGSKRMIGTVKRYLELAEVKDPDTVSKTKGKAL